MTTHPLGRTSLMVSQIGLGTAEIGMAYGVKATVAPTNYDAERVLKTAVDLGVTFFDTARSYGLAEERLGRFGISRTDKVVVATKCAQFLEKGEDPRGRELEHQIRTEVETSLRMLRVDSLQLVQLHGGSQEQIERQELAEVMNRLREEGKVQHIGIAVRGEQAAVAAIDSGHFEVVHLAYSILDQRMKARVFSLAVRKGVGIINRSVLLRGVLTPLGGNLPEQLAPLKCSREKAASIARDSGIDLPSLAVRFTMSSDAIGTALIGTRSPEHLRAAVAAANMGPLPTEIVAELEKVAIGDPDQVDPSKWPATR